MSADVELKALRWRCRRGMRELDQLLVRYLDQAWPTASEAERGVFRRVLATEDDKLWRAFLGQEQLEDADVRALVEQIGRLPH
jgi:antitoxin CptB